MREIIDLVVTISWWSADLTLTLQQWVYCTTSNTSVALGMRRTFMSYQNTNRFLSTSLLDKWVNGSTKDRQNPCFWGLDNESWSLNTENIPKQNFSENGRGVTTRQNRVTRFSHSTDIHTFSGFSKVFWIIRDFGFKNCSKDFEEFLKILKISYYPVQYEYTHCKWLLDVLRLYNLFFQVITWATMEWMIRLGSNWLLISW